MPVVIRYLFILFIAVATSTLHATVRTWPGASPCDTTLNACLAAAATGDTIVVQSNGPIDEDLTFNVPIALSAASGYRPVLKAGNSIKSILNIGNGVSGSVSVDGFTLLDGVVVVATQAGNLSVSLRHLDVTTMTPTSALASIYASVSTPSTSSFEISNNRVRIGTGKYLCGVFSDGFFSSTKMHDNRISTSKSDAPDCGLYVRASATNGSALVYSNQVSGNLSPGVGLTLTQDFSASFLNNSITCTIPNLSSVSTTQGMAAVAYAGAIALQVFNNNFVGCNAGALFAPFNSASMTGRVTNNIVANNSVYGFNFLSISGPLSNDHNVVFGNPSNTYTAGANTLNMDPKFVRGNFDTRLSAGSPAIDAADSVGLTTLLTNLSVPQIDADGARRFKGVGSVADIGAFEFGDVGLIENVTAANAGQIDDPTLNGTAAALPQLTQNRYPDSYAAPTYDPAFIGLSFTGTHFNVIEEAGGLAPVPLSSYNIFVPSSGSGAFLHTSGAGNIQGLTTRLTDASVAGQASRVILATHRSAPTYTHPFGVVFAFGNWYISQLDGSGTLPSNLNFDIYAQEPSLNAFVWAAPFAGTSTAIDHPLLNNESCGRVYVTNGNTNPHPVGVVYSGKRWNIVNLDGASIAPGTEFQVVVDEAATEACRFEHIFHDGFEGT